MLLIVYFSSACSALSSVLSGFDFEALKAKKSSCLNYFLDETEKNVGPMIFKKKAVFFVA